MAIISSRKKSFSTSFVGEQDKRLSKVQMERKINKKRKRSTQYCKRKSGKYSLLGAKKIIGSKKSIQVFDGNIFMIKILIKTFSAKDKLYNVQTRLC